MNHGHGGDENQLLRNGDIAMYRAKHCGRNRVEFYRQEATERVATNHEYYVPVT